MDWTRAGAWRAGARSRRGRAKPETSPRSASSIKRITAGSGRSSSTPSGTRSRPRTSSRRFSSRRSGACTPSRFQSGLFTWISRIARNECLNHLRRRVAPAIPLEAILGSGDEIDSKSLPPERSRGRSVMPSSGRRSCGSLSGCGRSSFSNTWRGLSYEEMSRALGCAPGTVASRLNRALAELGERLQPFRRL